MAIGKTFYCKNCEPLVILCNGQYEVKKIDAVIELLRPLGIRKLTRSGILALHRELDESHRIR